MKISDYPFTQEAAEAVRSRNISLDSLLDKSLFQSVRSRAAERLRGAVGGEAIPDGRASSESEQLFELLSYPLARVMVSCLNDPILLRRYALAEAKLAFRRMQHEKEGLVVLSNDLGINPQGQTLEDPFF